MWSYCLVPEIIRAAKFCSDCSLEIFLFDVFDHTVEQCGTVMAEILVAGKRLNLGVRGPGEKPFWGETRSSGTRRSHPGQES